MVPPRRPGRGWLRRSTSQKVPVPVALTFPITLSITLPVTLPITISVIVSITVAIPAPIPASIPTPIAVAVPLIIPVFQSILSLAPRLRRCLPGCGVKLLGDLRLRCRWCLLVRSLKRKAKFGRARSSRRWSRCGVVRRTRRERRVTRRWRLVLLGGSFLLVRRIVHLKVPWRAERVRVLIPPPFMARPLIRVCCVHVVVGVGRVSRRR